MKSSWTRRGLTFGQRALAPPVVAICGFVVLIILITWSTGRITERLGRLESEIFPTLSTAFRLDQEAQRVQAALEDGVNLEVESALDDASAGARAFLDTLSTAQSSNSISPDNARRIQQLFGNYFEPALAATTELVRQEATPATFQELSATQERFEALETVLEEIRRSQSSELTGALHEVSRQQRWNFLAAAIMAFVVVAILAISSLGLLRTVRRLADEVSGGVARINSSSSEMMSLLAQQEEASNQHAGAIEETTRTVDSLVESAQSIAGQARSVLEFARSTQSTNEEISERNRELSQSLEGITNILESVRDIANKSELLALNAALEGNKAGEAGRGFSLVAAQMQRLAESVMGNVEAIKKLIREVREASHRAVLAIEEGGRLALQTTESAESIQLVTRQQETATSQVTESMRDAALQIQQSVAGLTQSRESMESLGQLAAQLDDLLLELKVYGTEAA